MDKVYTFVSVRFSGSLGEYHYLMGSEAVAPGDIVSVPTVNGETEAVAVKIRTYTEDTVPYPLDSVKTVSSVIHKKRCKAYWTKRKDQYGAESYACSACGFVSASPAKFCPSCTSFMASSRVKSDLSDFSEEGNII